MSSLKLPPRGCAQGLALGVAVFLVLHAQHIHLHSGRHQRHHRMHVLRNAGRGVQRDGVPHRVDVAFPDAAAVEEVAVGVGAADLEALAGAAVLVAQAHVMEHAAAIQQFRVEPEAAPASGQRGKVEHPAGMVEKQRRHGVAHGFGNFAGPACCREWRRRRY